MAYSGKYNPKFPKKYKGDYKKIVYRSLWEKKFMLFCDSNSYIISWQSEETIVPYKSPITGKNHRYFVDFYIKLLDKEGNIKEYLVEIKPEAQTKPPKKKKRVTKRYLQDVELFLKNSAKWAAARKFAKKRKMEFLILTENHLGIKR